MAESRGLHRGDVWDADLPDDIGRHHAVLLSRDVAMARRHRAVVVLVTSNVLGKRTEVGDARDRYANLERAWITNASSTPTTCTRSAQVVCSGAAARSARTSLPPWRPPCTSLWGCAPERG